MSSKSYCGICEQSSNFDLVYIWGKAGIHFVPRYRLNNSKLSIQLKERKILNSKLGKAMKNHYTITRNPSNIQEIIFSHNYLSPKGTCFKKNVLCPVTLIEEGILIMKLEIHYSLKVSDFCVLIFILFFKAFEILN